MKGTPLGTPLSPDFSTKPYAVYTGDALETVSDLAAGGIKFDCVVTSPPYFHQRKYGEDGKEIGQEKGKNGVNLFIETLVTIFKAIPVNPWANLWINIGNKRGPDGTLMGVPSRFVIGMQDAGFYLMDDVVWAKEVVLVDGTTVGHCMIEPANGRLNGNGWEPFYRFVINPKRAWSDTCAVRIPRDAAHFFHEGTINPVEQHPYSDEMGCVTSLEGRNTTNVWHVGTSRKGKNHFAAYSEELVERPIAMTCPQWITENGPRERVLEQVVYSEGARKSKRIFGQYSLVDSGQHTEESLQKKSGRMDSARHYISRYPRTKGWTHEDKPATSGIVLDPFGGTGTTGAVAIRLGRRFIGIDLYQDVTERMEKRCQDEWEKRQPEPSQQIERSDSSERAATN